MRFIRQKFILFSLCTLMCIPASSFGMDYFWKDSDLVLSGEVMKGDSEKFRRFLYANFDKYKQKRYVRLKSNGGNLLETLKIAAILRSVYPKVSAEKCASSCFFLYLSGIERIYKSTNRIGIHRAYFDPSYFKNLGLEEARVKLAELTKIMNLMLDENQVPQYLKDRLNITSSDEIYWLTEADIESIGWMPPWFEELLIAKCDCKDLLAYLKDEYFHRPENPDRPFDADKVAKSVMGKCFPCWDELIAEQLSSIPQILNGEAPAKRKGAR